MQRRAFLMAATAALASRTVAFAQPLPPRLRAGQIGVRHAHASGKLAALRQLGELYEVVGVAEADERSRAAASRQGAYAGLPWLTADELLSDGAVRVVAVETTLEEATGFARRAIEAGKHVHLDKPGGADHAAFRQMRQTAEERGVIVQMGYMLRYNPAFELLFRAGREGWLGDVLEVDASMGKLAGAGLRRELAEHPGHGMFELACHLVDAVVTLLGPPTRVTPFAAATRAPGDPLPDNQLAVFEYPRALVTIRCNHADAGGGGRRRFAVVGSEGSLEIAPLESGRVVLTLAKPRGEYAAGRHELQLTVPRGRYDGEFRDLARAIHGERPFAWNAQHDIAVHAAALRAAGIDPDAPV